MTFTETLLAALPFLYFIAISSVTPGPNNLMLAASGMNFGIRRTIPHMIGVAVGFGVIMFLCCFGLGAAYHAVPQARIVLNVFSAAYILYLSYKIATSKGTNADPDTTARPMTFWQAALFQFVNPKGVVMGLASVSLLPEAPIVFQCAIILVVVFAINFPCVGIWTFFGRGMAKIFTTEKSRKIVNYILALMLVATIPMMMVH